MRKIRFYAENTPLLERVIEIIEDKYPCFFSRDYIEMNCSEIVVYCRAEDYNSICARIRLVAIRKEDI